PELLQYHQCLPAVGGGLHHESPFFEETAYCMPDQHRIIYNQRYWRHWASWRTKSSAIEANRAPGQEQGTSGRVPLPPSRLLCVRRELASMAGQGYVSSVVILSSMAMSLNSLDSKTSPHSRHSTYSASSSRLTICTRGCLHTVVICFSEGIVSRLQRAGFDSYSGEAPGSSAP